MAALEIPAPAVLENRGIPVLVHALKQEDAAGLRFEREYEEDDITPVLEKRYVRLTMVTQAGIEQRFSDDRKYVSEIVDDEGNTKYRLATEDEQDVGVTLDAMDLWQLGLDRFPASTISETLALIWDCTAKEAGLRLLDNAADEYATALAGAVALSQGAGADAVVRLLRTGVSSSLRLRDSIQQAVDAEIKSMEEEERKASESPASEPPENAPASDALTPTSPNVPTEPEWDSSTTSGAYSDALSVSSGT